MRRVLMILGAFLVFAGCHTVQPLDQQGESDSQPSKPTDAVEAPELAQAADPSESADASAVVPERAGVLSEVQRSIVLAAREVLQTQSTVVGPTTYPYDCSGTILTVFAHAGFYFIDLFARYSGNGVARLHGIAADYNVLHDRNLPVPGDVIFWDNTYDRNGDGAWNDQLTHAGLVLSVADDGTVEYLHHNYSRGIVTASMNLLKPEVYQSTEGTELNSPMRMASQRASNPDLWLSSHLFREFGSMYLIQIQTADAGEPAIIASAW